jgi:hypothetical protein
MPAYGISITLDTASPFAEKMARGIAQRGYGPAVGEAGKLVLINHFGLKEQEATSAAQTAGGWVKLGHSGLYADFRDATSWQPTGDGIRLSIAHPAIRQRLQGGTIRPVNARNLTIPARKEAYGKRASEVRVPLKFGYAFDEQIGHWRRALIADTVASKAKKTGAWFWLVPQVEQKPDSSVLPSDTALVDGVSAALRGWISEVSSG